ncbi:hypothetical protein SLNSH_10690 [Alsobacter soli]|uniref:Uncharacterized protein n=1 Tax=Alsobacter soli TaxID=2109933 RepID=A0A2T1HTD5_9HYPH|nr:hypothetical protein SLNSH_10690 [Alsobacter soli]
MRWRPAWTRPSPSRSTPPRSARRSAWRRSPSRREPLGVRRPHRPSSPGSSRGSTRRKSVGGRDKPGHDAERSLRPLQGGPGSAGALDRFVTALIAMTASVRVRARLQRPHRPPSPVSSPGIPVAEKRGWPGQARP